MGSGGKGFGAAIVNLQKTKYDQVCQIRIWQTIDITLGMLAEKLGLSESIGPPLTRETFLNPERNATCFEGLPYDKEGRLAPEESMRLDLTPGV